MAHTINLNADMAESYGAWTMGDDAALLDIVGSANLACGFHAGDPLHISRTLRLAAERGVSVGAHPAYPDLQGFGRRPMRLSDEELGAVLTYQVGALQALALRHGTRVTHVKPHGALNNLACADAHTAHVVASTVRAIDPQLILLAPAASALAQAGHALGLPTALEVFADRNYQADGQLVSRQHEHAMVGDAQACSAHVLRMLSAGGLVALDGSVLPSAIHSVCVHGDGAQAVETATAVKAALIQAGYVLNTLDSLV
jgi:5-oxoprolinase (ATP-hydrolysing) subunit A